MQRSRTSRVWWVAGPALAAGLALAGVVIVSGALTDPAPGALEAAGERDATRAGASAEADGTDAGSAGGAAVRPGRGGVRAVVDPVTGELVREPTPEMIDSGATAPDGWLRRRSADLVAMPLPQGGYIVDLEGRFQTSVVVSVGDDGSVETDCVAGDGHAHGSEGAGHDR